MSGFLIFYIIAFFVNHPLALVTFFPQQTLATCVLAVAGVGSM
jgi:hypothetical protein